MNVQVLAKDQSRTVLFDRTVVDTPGQDVPVGVPWMWWVFDTETVLEPTMTNMLVVLGCVNLSDYTTTSVSFDNFRVYDQPTPLEPLEIRPGPSPEEALLCWPRKSISFLVEQAPTPQGPWTTLPQPVTEEVGEDHCLVQTSQAQQFFRLREQQLCITLQPVPGEVHEGTNLTFCVTASGEGTLHYQWRLNGTNIPVATNACLVLENVQPTDAGEYRVLVADDVGAILSQPATLMVLAPPVIVQQPQSQTARVGDTVTFSVTVTNTATLPITYKWRSSSAIVETQVLNARASTYTIANVQLTHAGTYRVSVDNAVYPRGFMSDTATLTVEP